jgi:hypothetical protein
MRNSIGIPAPFVALMRLTPMWKGLKATAHTPPLRLGGARQAHDVRRAAERRGVGLRDGSDARRLRRQEPALRQQGSRAQAKVLPNAELRELEGVSHNVKMNVLAPVLAECD